MLGTRWTHLEKAFFTGKSKIENENVKDNANLVISLLKCTIISLESELSTKDGTIELLRTTSVR